MAYLKKIIDPGELDRKIDLRSWSDVQSSTGAVVTTHALLATVWAKVEHAQGKEMLLADKETAVQNTLFTIRHRTDLDKKMEVVFDSETYDIIAISEVTRRRFTEIRAQLRE